MAVAMMSEREVKALVGADRFRRLTAVGLLTPFLREKGHEGRAMYPAHYVQLRLEEDLLLDPPRPPQQRPTVGGQVRKGLERNTGRDDRGAVEANRGRANGAAGQSPSRGTPLSATKPAGRRRVCAGCSGSGNCPVCEGRGGVRAGTLCPKCEGSGNCPGCGGTGGPAPAEGRPGRPLSPEVQREYQRLVQARHRLCQQLGLPAKASGNVVQGRPLTGRPLSPEERVEYWALKSLRLKLFGQRG